MYTALARDALSCLRAIQTPRIETALMAKSSTGSELTRFPRRHLLTCEGLSAAEIEFLLKLADANADAIQRGARKRSVLSDRTLINLFFESSTRTQASFEMAGRRLGAGPGESRWTSADGPNSRDRGGIC